jgi:hypothetical protein
LPSVFHAPKGRTMFDFLKLCIDEERPTGREGQV